MPPGPLSRRVVHAVSQYGVVSEGFVVDAVGAVEPYGWESWVLCRDLRSPMPAVPEPDRIRTWGLPGGPLASRWARQALPGVDQLSAQRAVAPIIRSIDPAVVHAHFGWNLPDVVRTTRAMRVPLVTTFHASDVTIFPGLTRRQKLLPSGWGRAHRYSGIFEHVAAGIAVSEYIAAKVRALGFTSPVQVIPAGIRLEDFPYRPPDPTARALSVIFVGRLVPRKGLDVLLEALALREAPSTATLHVIGDGPERPALERLAGRLGLGERVRFAGAQPREAVIAAMQRSDVLVMPSRTMHTGEVEGSPVVTKEAQAIGLPVVATDNGGTRETLPPAHRADVVPEERPEAIARALSRLEGDRGSWVERCRVAREYVEREFGWDALGRRTAELYASLQRTPA